MTRHADSDFNGALDQGNLFYYDERWRLLEERVDDGFSAGDAADWSGNFDDERITQRMWGLEYIDELLYFQTDVHSTTGGVADGRFYGGQEAWYALTDRMFSVLALVDLDANVPERVRYTPYGEARHEWGSDLNGDGAVNSADLFSVFLSSFGSSYGDVSSPVYSPDCDLDQDGDVDSSDQALFTGQYTAAALAAGNISAPSVRNIVGYDGYLYDEAVGMHHVRHRWYDAGLGRWITRDSLFDRTPGQLYEYANGAAVISSDPHGQQALPVYRPPPLRYDRPPVRRDAPNRRNNPVTPRPYDPWDSIDPYGQYPRPSGGCNAKPNSVGSPTPTRLGSKDCRDAKQNEYDQCYGSGPISCSNLNTAGMTRDHACEVIRRRLEQARLCDWARWNESQRCYGGEDQRHKEERERQARDSYSSCVDKMIANKCSFPAMLTPGPNPFPLPGLQPLPEPWVPNPLPIYLPTPGVFPI